MRHNREFQRAMPMLPDAAWSAAAQLMRAAVTIDRDSGWPRVRRDA